MGKSYVEITRNSIERALKAWEMRKRGMLLREIGVAIGNLKDGKPLCTETTRYLCAKGERIEKRRNKIKDQSTKDSEGKNE